MSAVAGLVTVGHTVAAVSEGVALHSGWMKHRHLPSVSRAPRVPG